MPMWESMLKIRRLAPTSYSFEVTSFSTANTTPSLPLRATAVLMKRINHTIEQLYEKKMLICNSPAVLDGFLGILDLKHPAIRRKLGSRQVILKHENCFIRYARLNNYSLK